MNWASLDTLMGLIWVFAAIIAVFVLVLAVVKVRRDRAERASRRRSRQLVQSWRSGDIDHMTVLLRPSARGRTAVLSDLATTLTREWGQPWFSEERIQTLSRACDESGLRSRLNRDLDSRLATRRGLAAHIGGFPPMALDVARLAALASDPSRTVRLSVVASLGRLASPESANALIDMLISRVIPGPRIVERLGQPWAVPVILGRMSSDPLAADTTAWLLRALALAADPVAIEGALPHTTAVDDEVRIQAIRALARCAAAAPPDRRSKIADRMITACVDSNATVRTHAARALANLDHPDTLRTLRELAHDQDWHVRRAAGEALAASGPDGLEVLNDLVDDPDPFAAHRAREILTAMSHGARAFDRADSDE